MSASSQYYRAVIDWRSSNGQPWQALNDRMAARGFLLNDYLVPAPSKQKADAALIDLRAAPSPAKLLHALRPREGWHSYSAGIIAYTDYDQIDEVKKLIGGAGLVVNSKTPPIDLANMVSARVRLTRLYQEVGERLKSLAAVDAISQWPEIETANKPCRILVAGQPSTIALPLMNALKNDHTAIETAFGASQVISALDHTAYHAIVFAPEQPNDILVSLARALKKQGRYRGLPVFLVTDLMKSPVDKITANALRAISLDTDGQLLISEILSAAKLRKQQDLLTTILKDLEKQARRANAAQSRDYFQHHIQRLSDDAEIKSQPLTAIVIDMKETGLDKRALRLADRLIKASARLNDTVMRVGPAMWVGFFPATLATDGEAIAARFEKAASGSVDIDAKKPLSVSAVLERAPDEKAAELVARTLRELRARPQASSIA